MTGGGYQLGFNIQPLTADGNLDSSLDFSGGPHPVDKDPLYMMACESRECGNRFVKQGEYEQAIANYSELIMKTRTLEGEPGIEWDDAAKDLVRQLRAAAYLNLSLCFLKTEQWTHATNTATRAIQGDKDPVDPKEDVLAADKKAKALFRRATAHAEGFGNFDRALEDLRQAAIYAPNDKSIEQMLRKAEIAVKKTEKAANKKLAGFLNKGAEKGGDGIFGADLRPAEGSTSAPTLKEPLKLKEGLWVVPEGGNQKAGAKAGAQAMGTNVADDIIAKDERGEVDFSKMGDNISQLQESNPEVYNELRDRVQACLEEEVRNREKDPVANEQREAVVLEEGAKGPAGEPEKVPERENEEEP